MLIICCVLVFIASILDGFVKDAYTIVIIPILLVIENKILTDYLDTSNKSKLMKDLKLYHDNGIITDEEYEEKKRYIRKKLEDYGYVES